MPRKKIALEQSLPTDAPLTERLKNELLSTRESGQPLVYEQEVRSDRLRVLVIWDEWDRIPLEERTAVILRAYELALGTPERYKIALASGVTVPEATAAGMLPYQVGTALRKGDPVTFEQCWETMLAEGASRLFGPNILQLRFATRDEAEACRKRLIVRLPQSENVWLINREITVQDLTTLHDQAEVPAL